MPPRYAYWTILIDQKPTAFRAHSKDDLLPTLHQLQRKSPDAVLKWFARGRLWDTPEQAEWSRRNPPKPREPRGRDWRPGGEHRDPRARFASSSSREKQGGSRSFGEKRGPTGPHGERRGPADSQGERRRPTDSHGARRGPTGSHGARHGGTGSHGARHGGTGSHGARHGATGPRGRKPPKNRG